MERDFSPTQPPYDLPREKQFIENQLLNYKQAAKYLSVSESYLRKLKAKGILPHVFIGSRGIRFRVNSLNRWIEKREVTCR